jgi:hypothetical protein
VLGVLGPPATATMAIMRLRRLALSARAQA